MNYEKKIYSRPSLSLITGITLGCFLLGFFLNFSPENKILPWVQNQLAKNAPCPLQYNELKVLYLFPGVRFQHLTIPPRCAGGIAIPLKFDHLEVRLRGLDLGLLSPVISFAGERSRKFALQGEFSGSGKNLSLHLKNSTLAIDLLFRAFGDALTHYLPFNLRPTGQLLVDMTAQLVDGKLWGLKLAMGSGDLQLAAIDLLGFLTIPALDVGNLQVMGYLEKGGKKLILQKVVMGGKGRSLEATLKGEVQLVAEDMTNSQVRAKAKFQLAESWLQKVPLLKSALEKYYDKKDGFYHIFITNTLGAPELSPKKK